MKISDKTIIRKQGFLADEIIKLTKQYASWSDEQLRKQTDKFKAKIAKGVALNDLLIEAYATITEMIFRVTKMRLFRVQIIGAIVLHLGDVAEMKTGEGKTVTALLPAYLNALSGKGVHIITVNEYLSERDSVFGASVFNPLGLTVGLNLTKKNPEEKRFAYKQDVTYTTSTELGFDYLRDNMVTSFDLKTQRPLNYCIIDEADSILIDEARTPLIISGGRRASAELFNLADQFAKSLVKADDLEIDLETKQIFLTHTGVQKAEKFFSVKALFQVRNTQLYHSILNALKAVYIFKNGVEYILRANEIVLVDQNTGRLMEGRSYSDGLQQALQAKEKIEIEPETITLATITFQNFFRLYNKISGMTGTAKTEEEEFTKVYNMSVVSVPTNMPIIRIDEKDYFFVTRDAKMKCLMDDIQKLHDDGRPILIGTTSVESSEVVASYLRKAKLHFEMLNAKNHEREAEIIAKAGQAKAITLATNMAGRGTDIKLGPGIADKGGLVVFGIERNEARRIDLQLRGRSGRQGDPGLSRFYSSSEDDLIVRNGTMRFKKLLEKLGEDKLNFDRRLTAFQKKVEGSYFDQRKNTLDYDNILSQHREATYSERDQILTADDLKAIIGRMHFTAAYDLTNVFGYELQGEWFVDIKKMLSKIENKLIFANVIDPPTYKNASRKKLAIEVAKNMDLFYQYRVSEVPHDILIQVERRNILAALDLHWQNHIENTQRLRAGIYLRSYSQKNPLHEYVEESKDLYEDMKIQIANDVTISLASVVIKADEPLPTSPAERVEYRLKA